MESRMLVNKKLVPNMKLAQKKIGTKREAIIFDDGVRDLGALRHFNSNVMSCMSCVWRMSFSEL